MQKILIATAFPTEGAGSGALISTQAKSYVEAGLKVTIITANNRTNFKKIDGVKYHIVPFTGEVENPEKIDGQLPFNYLMFTTHTESTANFWSVGLDELEQYCKHFRNALNDELKKEKPDIIHAQHNWLLSSEATRMGVPVVTTIHGTDLMGYEKSKEYLAKAEEKICNIEKNEIMKKLEEIFEDFSLSYKQICIKVKEVIDPLNENEKKFAQTAVDALNDRRKYKFYIREAENSARNSNKIVVISEAQKEKFEKLFPYAAGKVELIENGYDPKTFYVDETITKEEVFNTLTSDSAKGGKISTDYTFLILFVGKFADFKGIDEVIISAKLIEERMKKEGKKPLIVIVGSGALDEKLKKQAKSLNLQNTHFVGRQNHDTIRKLQNLSMVSLIPSRNEPFGLVVIEGTACGHPVIASNSGGIPDIMNVNKEKLPNKDVIQTPLGLLIRPVPERPVMSEEEIEILDMKTSAFIIGDEEERAKIVDETSKKLQIDPKKLKQYFTRYEVSVNALTQAVFGVYNGEYVFDNSEIADYTKRVYSQEVIRDRFLKLFQDVIDSYSEDKEITD